MFVGQSVSRRRTTSKARETGDRRRSSMTCNRFPSSGLRPSVSAEAPPRQDAVTGCHPFHGFQLPFLFLRGVPHPTLPRGVLHRLAMGMSPVSRALNSARLRLDKFQLSRRQAKFSPRSGNSLSTKSRNSLFRRRRKMLYLLYPIFADYQYLQYVGAIYFSTKNREIFA